MRYGKQYSQAHKIGTLAAASCIVASSITQAATTFRTIALVDTQAPGTSAGTTFEVVQFPQISENGQVVFKGWLTGPDVDETNRYGVWVDIGGTLFLAARTGQLAPGTGSGTVFGKDLFNSLVMDDSGQIAFTSELDGPFVNQNNNHGIWVLSPGSFKMIARYGTTAPVTNGIYYNFSNIRITGPGQVSFIGTTTQVDNKPLSHYGIWRGDGTSLELVRQSSEPALDPNAGQTVDVGFAPNLTAFSDNGNAGIYGFLEGDGVTSANNNSIWSLTSSGMRLVARENEPAPGLGPGLYFEDFNAPPRINDAGQMLFTGYLGGPGVDDSNFRSIWTDTSGQLEMIARDGDPAPGELAGTTFSSVGFRQLTNHGKVYFDATLNDNNDTTEDPVSYWLHDAGGASLLIKSGGHLPGTAAGVVADSLGLSNFNDNGQGLMNAWLSGPGVDSSNDYGLWSINDQGHTSPILRKGDMFDVSEDPETPDLRTILSIHDAHNLNNHGQFSLTIYFTDGTYGIFAATLGLPGDLDGDGFVGINDLTIVLGNWNQNVPPADPLADPSGDGFIGIDDLTTVLGNWNAGTPPDTAANIPEPGTLTALVGLAGLGLIRPQRA